MNRLKYIIPVLALIVGCNNPGTVSPVPGEIQLNSKFQVDFELTDHFGKPATDERFEGKISFIYYGFTTCPDVCPAALGTMTATLDLLGKDAKHVQPLFITVDPKRDTVARLADHLAYDPRILGLTGAAEDVDHARDGLMVYAAEVPMPDSAMGYTMDHQRLFYVTNREGEPVIAANDAMAPKDLARLIRRHL